MIFIGVIIFSSVTKAIPLMISIVKNQELADMLILHGVFIT